MDAVATTVGPGLVGALLVGLAAGKARALATGVPSRREPPRRSHLRERDRPDEPAVCFLVSGGHTMLVHVPEPHRYRVLGETLDDAAGEAFDKVARVLGLGFPGGPALDLLARDGDPSAIRFPRAVTDGRFDSPAGLKTAVVRRVRAERDSGTTPRARPRGVVPGGRGGGPGPQDHRGRAADRCPADRDGRRGGGELPPACADGSAGTRRAWGC